MRWLAALPAAIGMIATAGCDFFQAGSALRQSQVEYLPAGGETVAEESAETLTVFFEARGNGADLVRAKAVGDETVWISTDLASLTERQGIITATQGLGTDLVTIETPPPSAWRDLPADRRVPAIHRYFSDAQGSWMRGYACEVSPARSVTIPMGDTIQTALETNVSCRNSDQAFENTYWQDRNGRMIQSRQWLGDQLGYANFGHPVPGNTRQAAAPGDTQ